MDNRQHAPRDTGLPSEQPVPATWRTVASSVGSLLALLVALNVGAGAYLAALPEPNLAYQVVRRKWQRLFEQPTAVDGLLLGDSACNQGISPRAVAAHVGGDALNLCTAGNMLAVGDVWMLEKYAERHGWPKYVLVVHVYDVWDRGPNPQLIANVPLRWRFWRDAEPRLALTADDELLAFLTRFVPMLSRRTAIAEALRGRPLKPANALVEQPDGYMRSDHAAPGRVTDDLAAHRRALHGKAFAMSDANRGGLRRLVRLADAKGFDLYLANAPVHERLYADVEFRRYFAAMQDALTRLTAGSRRAVYIPRAFVAPEGLLENTVDHLIHRGALSYSELLGREIAGHRARRLAADTTPVRIGERPVGPRDSAGTRTALR